MSTAPRIVIAHGWNVGPTSNWFPWLAEQYAPGVVAAPRLSEPLDPDLATRVGALMEALGEPDRRKYIVAHSLGCITTLRALDGLSGDWRLGGLVLVAGFSSPLPGPLSFSEFTEPHVDAARIASRVGRIAVIASDNDPGVPLSVTTDMADELGAATEVIPQGDHFSERTGWTTFPHLLPILDSVLGDDLSASLTGSQAKSRGGYPMEPSVD